MKFPDAIEYVELADQLVALLRQTGVLSFRERLLGYRSQFIDNVLTHVDSPNKDAARSYMHHWNPVGDEGFRSITNLSNVIHRNFHKFEDLVNQISEKQVAGLNREASNISQLPKLLDEVADIIVDFAGLRGARDVMPKFDSLMGSLNAIDKIVDEFDAVKRIVQEVYKERPLRDGYEGMSLYVESNENSDVDVLISVMIFVRTAYRVSVIANEIDEQEFPLVLTQLHLGTIFTAIAGATKAFAGVKKLFEKDKLKDVKALQVAIEQDLRLRDAVQRGLIPESEAEKYIQALRVTAMPLIQNDIVVDGVKFSRSPNNGSRSLEGGGNFQLPTPTIEQYIDVAIEAEDTDSTEVGDNDGLESGVDHSTEGSTDLQDEPNDAPEYV
jgi:hypothetical protein